jgi:ribosome-associated protein
MSEFDDPNHDDDIEWVSKSEIKREMHQLQEIGEKLLNVKKTELAKFPLSDELRAAVEESSRIKKHEAIRRHLQYIGKLMRNEKIDEIQACLDKLDPSSELYLRVQGQAEAWREKLIRNANAEGEWFGLFPDTDRQPFRALVRAAKKEQSDDPSAPILAGKNGKKLLQWIRAQLLE